jgi:3,4-dihydroxy 2-butanone 4-phosphate synthase/GTP cyclohydrolase II
VFGDLKGNDPLYIRMHSSCITSECLRSTDCDCVEQLEGALQKISQKGSGILFYLMQEGRGSGYVAKSRDRMLVQYVEGTDK